MPELTAPKIASGAPGWQAILLDRDGTINCERADYVKSWAELEWLPGALEALAVLATLDIPILVVSNQSAVGRGILEIDTLAAIHDRMCTTVAATGGRIDAFFVCPHRPDEHCTCRKPKPGLLLQAAQRFDLDLGCCLFVGDSVTDLQAAQAAGCPCILVRTGRQGERLPELVAALPAASGINPSSGAGSNTAGDPVLIVDDLAAAVTYIGAAHKHAAPAVVITHQSSGVK